MRFCHLFGWRFHHYGIASLIGIGDDKFELAADASRAIARDQSNAIAEQVAPTAIPSHSLGAEYILAHIAFVNDWQLACTVLVQDIIRV
ncbi:hypothetical protein WR30_11250 [Burkholderia contaminans FFH2055]|nr:hypothetical protein WR30_11250 [Burkholderia contaminans FFH2055]